MSELSILSRGRVTTTKENRRDRPKNFKVKTRWEQTTIKGKRRRRSVKCIYSNTGSSVRLLAFDSANPLFRYGLELSRMSRGRTMTSESGVEDREMELIVTWGWVRLVSERRGAMPDRYLNLQAGSDVRPDKISGRVSVLSPFE